MADPDDAYDQGDDPDLDELLLHADREELESYLPLARRLLEAAGDEDLDDVPLGEALVQGLYVLTGGSYDVGGRDDPLAWVGLGFVVAPERMRTVVRFWRRAAELDDREIEGRVRAVREKTSRDRCRDREDERPRSSG